MLEIDKKGNLIRSKRSIQKRSKKKTGWNMEYTGVGFYLLTPILLGLGVGLLLDRWLGTRPIATILFLLFGVIGCFYNIRKLAK